MSIRLRIIDSITELVQQDAGCLAVSGSHGGRSSAQYALAARPLLSVFNDAGVGREDAGIAALHLLQRQSLAACTVAHHSARIGEAISTWQDGVISDLNSAAQALGLREGQALAHALITLWPEQQVQWPTAVPSNLPTSNTPSIHR